MKKIVAVLLIIGGFFWWHHTRHTQPLDEASEQVDNMAAPKAAEPASPGKKEAYVSTNSQPRFPKQNISRFTNEIQTRGGTRVNSEFFTPEMLAAAKSGSEHYAEEIESRLQSLDVSSDDKLDEAIAVIRDLRSSAFPRSERMQMLGSLKNYLPEAPIDGSNPQALSKRDQLGLALQEFAGTN